MATGGVCDFDIGTDETFEILCSKCTENNKNTEAEQFCVECHYYYCSKCVKTHNEFPALKTHKILDKAQFQPGSNLTLPEVPTERCKVHAHKPVDIYCQQHDTVGCSICMLDQHNSCKDKFYVPDYVKNNASDSSSKYIGQLVSIANCLAELQNAFVKEREKIKSSKEMSLKQIRKFRIDINRSLDELERETTKQLEERVQSRIDNIEAELKEIQDLTKEVESAQDSLVCAEGNMSQMFVSIKMADAAASRASKFVNFTQVSSTQISFTASRKLQSLLTSNHVLGFISGSKDQPQTRDSLLQMTTTITHPKSHEAQSSSPSLLHTTGQKKYAIKQKSDKNTCSIYSACTLKDGTIIIADYGNSKLKRLDKSSFTITGCCHVPLYPRQVCAINNKEVAVSCGYSKLIQFVSVGPIMKKTRPIITEFDCFGLAFGDAKLFVSDKSSVYVFTLSGDILQQYKRDPSKQGILSFMTKQSLFSDIASLAVSSDNSKIYIADLEKGLIILDKNGRLVGQFSSPQLQVAYAVCLAKNDSVLVCGYQSRNVIQFDSDGKLLGEILKTDTQCQAVYCKSNTHLIVGLYNKNEIEVFDIHET